MARRSADLVHGPGWYGAAQAARLTGLSLAMVNYLCRTKIIEPSCSCRRGHGSQRHYAFGDLIALRLVARLSRAGISPLRLRKGLQYLKAYQPDITVTAAPASHIVTDGQFIYLRNGSDALERATDGQYAFAFVIEIDQVRREVVDKMSPVEIMLAVG